VRAPGDGRGPLSYSALSQGVCGNNCKRPDRAIISGLPTTRPELNGRGNGYASCGHLILVRSTPVVLFCFFVIA
jgi:hypothetical protein